MNAALKLTLRKEVYRISNVDGGFDEHDMTNFLKRMGIHVVSCFDRTPTTSRIINNKAFRVCIYSVDRDKLLQEDNWYSGIVIQNWIFNPKKTVSDMGAAVPPLQVAESATADNDNKVVGNPPNDASMDEGASYELASNAEGGGDPPHGMPTGTGETVSANGV